MVDRIAGYEIIAEVGQGAMATVYRARAVSADAAARAAGAVAGDVAIKVLRAEYLTDLGFRARFEREGQVIARLAHAAIVPVYAVGQSEDQLYIVMAYMPHGSLAERLLQGLPPIETAMEILARVGVALDYAHRQGVVHRDLKPSNVLFDAQDKAYLADFGIAAQVKAESDEGATISGTPAYMSPEQVRRERTIGAASDLYGLGVLAFQLLTGQLPFRAETPVAVLMQHVLEPPPAPRNINAALPPGVEAVLLKALAKDPAHRYESGAAFVSALRRALAGAGEAPAPGVEEGVAAAPIGESGEQASETAGARAVPAGDEALPRRERLRRAHAQARRELDARRRELWRGLAARPRLALALATACGALLALVAVLLLRGPQLAASRAAQATETAGAQPATPAADGDAGGAAAFAQNPAAAVFLPLVRQEPGRVTPAATAVANGAAPEANVRMLYDSGAITLLNISAGHVALGDVALRRVSGDGADAPTFEVGRLNRVAGRAVDALPAGDCLQLLGVAAVRSRGVRKPAECGTLRGWLATRETNQLFEGLQEGDAFEVVQGEAQLALCDLTEDSCQFFVSQE